MNVARCRNASADVEELPDAGLTGDEPHGTLEERPVLPCHRPDLRRGT
jgi:hypothetical protein